MSESQEPKLFGEGHPASDFILEWWDSLKKNKGDRAELRRCKNLKDVESTSTYMRCYWKLLKSIDQKEKKTSWDQAAIIIGLASHIEDNVTKYRQKDEDGKEAEKDFYFGYQLAMQKGLENKNPKLSELRFRRLLKIKNRDREKLYHFLVQVIRMLEKKVNMLDLLSIAYFWGDTTKTNLAYKYYEKANLEK